MSKQRKSQHAIRALTFSLPLEELVTHPLAEVTVEVEEEELPE